MVWVMGGRVAAVASQLVRNGSWPGIRISFQVHDFRTHNSNTRSVPKTTTSILERRSRKILC
ncbi:hypothetical protein BRADI_4g33495v3 [Brachypodium distachyon]|uniref:Uncharacterized protein n=1 Tax=Brachypodium distachyon TaxID=15368 RepID=A0A2K2CS16_BRADI|nr:hypothetical protein BRADI_4g33495v3 [Brachypodium distachyon]